MTLATTGEFSIASLSRREVQSLRTNTATGMPGRQMLTAEVKSLDFPLDFATGERLTVRLVGNGNEPSCMWSVFNLFRELACLQSNWDSYGSQPLSASVVRRSCKLLPLLLSDESAIPNLIPTRDGGIQFEWHRGGIDVELKIPRTGPISYLIADANTGAEQEAEGTVDLAAIREALDRVSKVQ